MEVFVRFENYANEDKSGVYGPYPFVRLTYNDLRVGPDGDVLAVRTYGPLWVLLTPKGRRVSNTSYSDVIIGEVTP